LLEIVKCGSLPQIQRYIASIITLGDELYFVRPRYSLYNLAIDSLRQWLQNGDASRDLVSSYKDCIAGLYLDFTLSLYVSSGYNVVNGVQLLSDAFCMESHESNTAVAYTLFNRLLPMLIDLEADHCKKRMDPLCETILQSVLVERMVRFDSVQEIFQPVRVAEDTTSDFHAVLMKFAQHYIKCTEGRTSLSVDDGMAAQKENIIKAVQRFLAVLQLKRYDGECQSVENLVVFCIEWNDESEMSVVE